MPLDIGTRRVWHNFMTKGSSLQVCDIDVRTSDLTTNLQHFKVTSWD